MSRFQQERRFIVRRGTIRSSRKTQRDAMPPGNPRFRARIVPPIVLRIDRADRGVSTWKIARLRVNVVSPVWQTPSTRPNWTALQSVSFLRSTNPRWSS